MGSDLDRSHDRDYIMAGTLGLSYGPYQTPVKNPFDFDSQPSYHVARMVSACVKAPGRHSNRTRSSVVTAGEKTEGMMKSPMLTYIGAVLHVAVLGKSLRSGALQ